MKHVMLDLETLSTASNAAIVSIGAVQFSESGVGKGFYRCCVMNTIPNTSHVQLDTVRWWLTQDDKATSQLIDGDVTYDTMLKDFREFLPKDIEGLWGNGVGFDNVILSTAYRSAGQKQPWPFWADRCYRTVKNGYRDIELERVGTYHNPLDDARSQALHLIKINKAAKGIWL